MNSEGREAEFLCVSVKCEEMFYKSGLIHTKQPQPPCAWAQFIPFKSALIYCISVDGGLTQCNSD